MIDLEIIAFGAGLRDGLNPCLFMTCAVFAVLGFLSQRSFLRSDLLRFIFTLVYAAGTTVFNFGPAQAIVFRKEFVFGTKVIYFVLGVWTLVLGILFLKDWFLLWQGKHAQNNDAAVTPPKPLALLLLPAGIIAVALSALATFWPIDNYVMILGNEALVKGQWRSVMPLLITYVLTSMWPLWCLWAFLSIKKLQPTLLKIVSAAIFFTASSCMIFIFR